MNSTPQKDIFSYLKQLISPGLRGFFLFFLLTFSFLLYLGTWQLNRLEWKNILIKEINQNLSKPPISFDDLLIETLQKNKSPDYRRVNLVGVFEESKPFKLLMKMQNETLGYHLIVPFVLESGPRILVNIGWVPATIDPSTVHIPTSPQTLKTIAKTKTGRSSHTPDNNYKTHDLFNLDPLELAHEKTWPALLPFFVTLTSPLHLPKDAAKKYPLPIEMQIAIRNAHLEYALTWYLLALFWLIIFVVYARHKTHNLSKHS